MQQGTSQFLYPYDVEGFDGGRAAIRWSADEQYVIIDNWARDIFWIVALDGAYSRAMTDANSAHWSPAENLLAYVSGFPAPPRSATDEAPTVSVMSADGSFSRDLGFGSYIIWRPNGQQLMLGYDYRYNYEGEGFWLVDVGEWIPRKLDLPPDAYVIDWQ